MNNGYQSTSPARTLTAIAFAMVCSATFVLSAVAPAHIQAAQGAATTEVRTA